MIQIAALLLAAQILSSAQIIEDARIAHESCVYEAADHFARQSGSAQAVVEAAIQTCGAEEEDYADALSAGHPNAPKPFVEGRVEALLEHARREILAMVADIRSRPRE